MEDDAQGHGQVRVGEDGGLGEVKADGGEAVEEDCDEEDEGVSLRVDLPDHQHYHHHRDRNHLKH